MQTTYDIENGFVKIPVEEFEKIQERLEDQLDEIALRHSLEDVEEFYPAQLVEKIINGENGVRVFRLYRGITQNALAEIVGISQAMIVKIENGQSDSSVETIKKIASALDVDVDMII